MLVIRTVYATDEMPFRPNRKSNTGYIEQNLITPQCGQRKPLQIVSIAFFLKRKALAVSRIWIWWEMYSFLYKKWPRKNFHLFSIFITTTPHISLQKNGIYLRTIFPVFSPVRPLRIPILTFYSNYRCNCKSDDGYVRISSISAIDFNWPIQYDNFK